MKIGKKDKVMMLVILSIAAVMCLSVIGVSSMSTADSVLIQNTDNDFLITPMSPGESNIPSLRFGSPATDAINASANYLIHAQADVTEDNALNNPEVDPDDGGWDWVLTYPAVTHSAAASPTNIYGVTALGLYYSYMATQMNSITPNARYMIAMTDAANKMVANANIRSASDLIFLMLYDDLPSVCGTTYQTAAKAKYDARIATYGTAQAFAQYIRDVRCASYPNGIIAWDIGAWVKVAAMLDTRYGGTYGADADAMAEVIYQDSYMDNPGCFDIIDDQGFDPTYANVNYLWYTLGITGIVDAFDAAQVHTDKIPGLLTILNASQYPTGAYSGSYGANPGDEDWQSTAYAVMTFGNLNAYTYRTLIQSATSWIRSTQHSCGGWVYSDNTHYPEICGELLSALYFDGTVYNTNTGEVFWSIQAAIDDLDTINGHTIEVLPGTYKGLIIVYKEVTIHSSAGYATTIIDANNIDVCNYRNQWCKGITYTWALANDHGLTHNGFLVFVNNTVIDGFKIINALWPTQYNRGIGIIVGTISTTYVSWCPWNIDQWGGTVPNPKQPHPTGVILRNNYIDGASDGIYNWASNGNIFEYNTIVNSVAVGGNGIQCYEGGKNNIIRGNTIDNVDGCGVSVCGLWPDGLLDVSNTKVYDNVITNSAVGIQFYNMGGSGVAAYHNDLLNNGKGIIIEGVGTATVATAYENNIVGNTAYGVQNACPTGIFSATCNWWGAASGPGPVGPGSGDKVSTNVNYGCPWLNAAYPDGTCIGGTVCWNTRTGLYYCSIQSAVYDNPTHNGDTIQVFDGVHYEHVNVNKSLTIELDPVRAPTVIDGGGSGYGFQINAPDVTIDGFEIRNCQIGIQTYGYAWGYPSNFHDLTIKNCDIHANTMNGIIIMHDIFSNNVIISNCDIHNNGQNGIGIADAAKITNKLVVQDSLFYGQGHHNMYFSNTQITTINVLNTDLTNTLSFGSGMCFNTAKSTIGTLYVEGGTMAGNAEGLCINQAPSTFTKIWLNGVDIVNNRESGVLLGGGTTAQSLIVEHCIFAGNAWEDFDLSGGWYGAFNSPSILFEHNDFNGPAWCGLYIGSAGVMPSITVHENNFYNPSLYAIGNDNSATVQATCNYYGHNTGPRHSSMPSCSQGRIVYGNAVVKPYLNAAYPGGICIQPVIANPDGPYSGNVGANIQFTGSATGGQSPYSYYWTLGDATTSTLQNPTHNYWTAGYYPVTLTVTDSLGIVSCIASTSVTIVPPGTNCVPEVWVDDDYTTSTPGWQVDHFALLQYALDAVCPGGIVHVYPGNYGEGIDYYNAHVDGVTIIGENIPLTFDIQTGNSAIIGLPLHITGDYNTVNYLVFNPSITGAVIVSGDYAVVQYNKFLRECLSGNPIGIENQGETILDARFNWWGRPDGPAGNTLDTNTGRIADGLGVIIVDNGPVLFDPWAGMDAVASASNLVVETGESILFNSVNSFAYHLLGETNDFEVLWEFGDGVYSFEKQVAHVYSSPGTYDVSLRLMTSDPELWGAFMFDWDYLTITVTNPGAPLSANADGSNLGRYETTVDEYIQLYGLAVGGTSPYTYYWDLGDGKTSDMQNPTHIYNKAGTYTATLTVTDNVGAIATDTTQITVYEIGELIVNINADKNSITGLENLFSAKVSGGKTPYTFSWNFGDGITSTLQNPTHIYEDIGTYMVTLTVTDDNNNIVSDSVTVVVEEGESDLIPAEIKQVTGGFGIKATIAAGNSDCDWTININGKTIFFGGEASGTIESNTQETVKLPLTLAFGKVQITVTANEIQKQYTAFALGPLFLKIQEI